MSRRIIQMLERLPLLLLALMIISPGILGLLSLGLGRSWLTLLEGAPLWGLPEPKPATRHSFLTGDWQRNSEEWVNRTLPLRPLFVRWNNQLFYSLFQKSYAQNEGLIIGKGQQLYGLDYLHRHCSVPSWTNPQPTADGKQARLVDDLSSGKHDMAQWIRTLQQIATFYQKRDKTFLYVIAPSKPAIVPEGIPDTILCAPPDRRNLEYKQQIQALARSGLPYVDSFQILEQAKERYDTPLFPRGGIHWNMLGATIVTQQIYEKIDQLSDQSLPPLEFSYQVTHQPTGTDQDLLMLLNLAIPDKNYPVPQVTVKPVLAQKLKLTMLGDSFMEQPLQVFNQLNVFCQLDEYRYLKLRNQLPTANRCGSTIDAQEHLREILDADVLVVMETSSGMNAKYITEFRNELVQRDPTIVQLAEQRFSAPASIPQSSK